jgi:hypothetical protein
MGVCVFTYLSVNLISCQLKHHSQMIIQIIYEQLSANCATALYSHFKYDATEEIC